MLLPGDPAPYFMAASSANSKFHFETVAGRYVVLSFFGSTRLPTAEKLLMGVLNRTDRFDAIHAAFFGVSVDSEDAKRLAPPPQGVFYFWDFDLAVSRRYGVVEESPPAGGGEPPVLRDASADKSRYRPCTFVMDPALRVIGVIPYSGDASEHLDRILSLLDAQPAVETLDAVAPVLVVPHVFEPELCRILIDYYEARGGGDSGFMRDEGGLTVGVYDYSYKRRMDCEVVDDKLITAAHQRFRRRLIPAIRQAFQFDVTRVERHIVACYDAAQGAHFRAHRDNTSLGTVHRRFAVTINLNSPDYEGGELCFPEFGPRRFKAPSGSAIVFSCSLMHEVPRVTRGKRYAFLPFLYDDAAAGVRAQNQKYIAEQSAGAPPTHVCETNPAGPDSGKPLLTGESGCGNPQGCDTCLGSATYTLGLPAEGAAK